MELGISDFALRPAAVNPLPFPPGQDAGAIHVRRYTLGASVPFAVILAHSL